MSEVSQAQIDRASSTLLTEVEVLFIFDIVVIDEIPNYISSYNGTALSDSWVKSKGQDLFWRGKGFNEGKGMFSDLLKITPVKNSTGIYTIGNFTIDINSYKGKEVERFIMACDRIPTRRFLPNNELSFDGGKATPAFCNFIRGLATKVMLEYGLM